MNDQTRFPLSWPAGWPRTPATQRRPAAFSKNDQRMVGDTWHRVSRRLSLTDAIGRLTRELARLGASDELLSTNVRLNLSGLPHGGAGEPADVGAAVYFKLKGQDRCLACDKWLRVADNVAAIAQHIDAIRRIDRYGVGTLEQAFAGYTALPARGATWRSTLGFPPDAWPSPDDIEREFRKRARGAHPDVAGGSHDAMAALTTARNEGLQEIGR